jgi:hypothetical protein
MRNISYKISGRTERIINRTWTDRIVWKNWILMKYFNSGVNSMEKPDRIWNEYHFQKSIVTSHWVMWDYLIGIEWKHKIAKNLRIPEFENTEIFFNVSDWLLIVSKYWCGEITTSVDLSNHDKFEKSSIERFIEIWSEVDWSEKPSNANRLSQYLQQYPTGPGVIMVLHGPIRSGFAVS